MKIIIHLIFLTTFLTVVNSYGFSQTNCDTLAIRQIEKLPQLYLEEAVNKKRLDLLPQIFSDNYVFHEMNGTNTYKMKNNSLKSFLQMLFTAFPDLHYTIDNIVKENDKIAIGCTATGTNKGNFFGQPATGNKVIYKEMFIYRVETGKIVEGWGVVDLAGVKDQLSKK
jgi:steroid delta-isomerase-like uncharacterized protein